MGFYTNFYDTRKDNEFIETDFHNRYNGKYAGGGDLWDWCFKNNVTYAKNFFYGFFIIELETLEKMIEEKAMGRYNTNSILRNIYDEMVERNLVVIYFEGDY